MLKIKIHILDIQRHLSDDLSLNMCHRKMQRRLILHFLGLYLFLPLWLSFIVLILTSQVAEGLKEIKIQSDPESNVHSTSGLSVLSLLYLRTVSQFVLKKELSSFCLSPPPFTEPCFLRILRILSKIFL